MVKLQTNDQEVGVLLESFNGSDFSSKEEAIDALKKNGIKDFILQESSDSNVIEVQRILRG